MLNSYFTAEQEFHLSAAITVLILAVVLYSRGHWKWALITLTAAALIFRSFAMLLDPYLSFWDEAYHAAVARNMVQAPFTPRLHWVEGMPVLGNWTNTTIWLHKPPFFLWQMAASVGLFGPEPWAVRLPSALWTAALVPVTYRIATLLTGQRSTAFMSAAAMACSFYLQEITSGALNTDHNDAVFISLVACSWWAFLEYWQVRTRKWAMLVGVFSAAAVLTKWYLGLSVFTPWILLLVTQRSQRRDLHDLLLSAFIVILVGGIWISRMFLLSPEQAAFEIGSGASRMTGTLEGHEGPWSYHLDIIHKLLRPWSTFLVFAAIAWLVFKTARHHRIFLLTLVLGIHLLFGIASTKMPSYTMVLLPIYVIALSCAITGTVRAVVKAEPYQRIALASASFIMAIAMLSIQRTHHRHTLAVPELAEQQPRRQQLAMLKAQDELITMLGDPSPQVVFNMPAPHDVQFMFRSGFDTMSGIPSQEQVDRLRRNGYEVVVIQDDADPSTLPAGAIVIPADLFRLPK